MSAITTTEPQQENVRRYFTMLSWTRQTPTAMLSWTQLPGESYFFGLSQPPPQLNPQRKESASKRQTLGELFSGFAWE